MTSAVAGPSMIGPSLPPTTADVKPKHGHRSKLSKEERKERKHRSKGSDGDASDASSHSAASHGEPKKKKKKQDNEKRRRGSDASFTSVTSMSEAGDDQRDETDAKDLRKMKGKGPAQSAFRYVKSVVDVPIPPALNQDAHRAADELMDTLLMRYIPQFGGVLMCHTNIAFEKNMGTIDADGAYSVVPVQMTCLVWAPRIGMRLEGKINLSTHSHVSLLVHGIFNASITSAHLPSIQEMAHMRKETGYQWQELPHVADVVKEDTDGETGGTNGAQDEEEIGEKSTGYWVDQKTGERLGGEDGTVVFTVVGLTIANNMLSIHGSLLRKPFSIPAPTYVPTAKQQSASSSDAARRVRFQDGHQTSEFAPYDEESGDEEDEAVSTNVMQPRQVQSTATSEDEGQNRKRSKVGPRRKGETSGSEDEGEGKREKKKRKKDSR